jgi:hypothetical protein
LIGREQRLREGAADLSGNACDCVHDLASLSG